MTLEEAWEMLEEADRLISQILYKVASEDFSVAVFLSAALEKKLQLIKEQLSPQTQEDWESASKLIEADWRIQIERRANIGGISPD